MKKLVIIILAILLSHLVNAQDVITKKNGDEINAKILEINKSEVKYKRLDNVDGPTFSIDVSDIFMIKYANGTKDIFKTDNPAGQNNGESAANKEYSSESSSDSLYNFGTIKQGDVISYDFYVTNYGSKSTAIFEAHGSCSCVTVQWPSASILPGEKAQIKGTFNSTNKQGMQDKTITINFQGGKVSVVHFKGNVSL